MNLENLSKQDKIQKIKSTLNTTQCLVRFVKKDGSGRSMLATTSLELIPTEFHPKIKDEVVDNTGFEVEEKVDPDPVFKVYEENVGWRSFRYSQLTHFNGMEITKGND